jgi:hypothetical protein
VNIYFTKNKRRSGQSLDIDLHNMAGERAQDERRGEEEMRRDI